jgi:hypothetical protein
MGEPGKNGFGPATELEVRELASVHIFKGGQNGTHFLLCVPGNDTERSLGREATTELSEDGYQAEKRFPSRG